MDALPDEMVSRVLELGAADGRKFVGVMRLVCRRFNQVALASPRLWTRVTINNRTLPGALFLATRAGSVPLQLQINLGIGQLTHPVTAILQHCRRYDALTLRSEDECLFYELVTQLRYAPDGLRELRLVYNSEPDPVWDGPPSMANLTLPNLTKLYMRRVRIPLPCTPKLRSLSLYGESAIMQNSEWLRVLQTCPLLQKIERITRSSDRGPLPPCSCPPPDHTVPMLRLTHLLLYTRSEHEMLFAISTVCAPELDTLVVAGNEGWGLEGLVLGVDLHPSLRQLKTFGIVLPNIARTLSRLSTLTHFIAQDSPKHDNGILETLLANALTVEEDLLLPNLQHLTLLTDHTGKKKRNLAPLSAARAKRGAPVLNLEPEAATAPSI